MKSKPNKKTTNLPWLTQRAALWRGIRALATSPPGGFAASDLARIADTHKRTATDVLHQLVAAGILTARLDGLCTLYRAVSALPETAPRLTRAGEVRAASGQDRMWVAIKPLSSFTPAEVAFCAAVPEVAAADYLARLHRAGYLAVVEAHVAGLCHRRARYRLIPGMDTGPAAPAIRRDKTVFDRNLNAIMAPIAAEVAS